MERTEFCNYCEQIENNTCPHTGGVHDMGHISPACFNYSGNDQSVLDSINKLRGITKK